MNVGILIITHSDIGKQMLLTATSVYGNKIPPDYEKAFRSLDPRMVVEKTLEMLKK